MLNVCGAERRGILLLATNPSFIGSGNGPNEIILHTTLLGFQYWRGIIAVEGMIDVETYEFLAQPENGVIRIPERYKSKIPSRARVTVRVEEVSSVRDILLPPSLDTRRWKFDREEANERR